jgi:hypothetical protein
MNNNELMDMLQAYFENNRNGAEACRVYKERFPDRQVPNRRKFARLESNLRNYGNFK